MWGYNGFGVGGMGLGMLLFWGLIIAAIVLLFRGFAGQQDKAPRTTPREILRERYAKGQIDKAEFEQKCRDLGAG